MHLGNFFAELKRRNVYKVAVGYAVVGWLVMQVAATIVPALHLPDAITSAVVVLTLLGFPVALVIAWAFEMTPEGMKRTEDVSPNEKIPQWSRRKFATFIVVVAVVAAALLAWQFIRPGRDSQPLSSVGPGLAIPEKSIAVLPFDSLSDEKANAYFAEGIQDEILTKLAGITDLKVISRTSTAKYQSKPGNIAEIARQLGVAHVLEGSVQKAGDSVRVNVQLIKAEGDSHLWAETYDRKLLDVFAVESEVAGRIASSLAAKLTGREKQELAHVPTDNSEAYDAYLRGLALDSSQSEEELEKSRKFFRHAVELDPQFALAWAYLANREAWNYLVNHTPDQLAVARHAMETALKLRPEASEAHTAAGSFYYYCLQDYDRALAEFQKARELSPSSANAIVMTAMVKRRQGDQDESIRLQLEAAAIDPRNADVWVNLGRSYRGLRRFAQAREMFDRALTIVPADKSILGEKIETYLAEGDLDTADKALAKIDVKPDTRLFGDYVALFILRRDFAGGIAFLQKHLSDRGTSPSDLAYGHLGIAFNQVLLGQFETAKPMLEALRKQFEEWREKGGGDLYLADTLIDIAAVLGDRAAVERESEKLLRETAHDRWRYPSSEESAARGFAILGDADRALPHLERALSMPARAGLTLAYLRLDPVWDRIRKDPRFQELVK